MRRLYSVERVKTQEVVIYEPRKYNFHLGLLAQTIVRKIKVCYLRRQSMGLCHGTQNLLNSVLKF